MVSTVLEKSIVEETVHPGKGIHGLLYYLQALKQLLHIRAKGTTQMYHYMLFIVGISTKYIETWDF